MIYTYPHYYDRFSCKAGACPDTCCAGWRILIDDESLEKYEKEQSSYKKVLEKNIDWEEAVFQQDSSGRCAFLKEDGLCDLYIHLGEESLCKTCKDYPRHTEEFENIREVTLSLSCPEVADLLMHTREKVTFISKEDEEEEYFDEYDYFLFSTLLDVREKLLNLLQDRTLPLKERMVKLLAIGRSIQRNYEQGTLMDWEKLKDNDWVLDMESYELAKKQFGYLYELEHLSVNWENILIESDQQLFTHGEEKFMCWQRAFEQWWTDCGLLPMEIIGEQILVYFISTYFLGAVYDENMVGKVDACVAHWMLIRYFLCARWILNGENLSVEDLVEIVYRYSREIEHSDENLESVEVIPWF